MKDPDDFPVSLEAERNVLCLDCGTTMARHERVYQYQNGYMFTCCQCGSTELDRTPGLRPPDDLTDTLEDIALCANLKEL